MVSDWAWGQFGLLFWLAACLFASGARAKSIPMGWRTWAEIFQAAGIVVILFALMSEGRGCSSVGPGHDADLLCVGDANC